jgi:hypothetical protein
MTDKLYFGAATACRLNQQPNTFMRTQLLKSLSVLLCLGLVWCSMNLSATAQIAVGSTGSAVDAFSVIPPASSWSMKSLTGGAATPESDATMDQFVNGLTNGASTISLQVSNVTGNPPGVNVSAMWTPGSGGNGYLITRPTGNAVTLMMATLTNTSGSSMQAFNVRYEYTQKTTGVTSEAVKGHRVYYSRTGAGGSWVPIGDFGNSFTTNILQNIVIGVDLGGTPWAANSAMYLLFADDNSNLNNDGANAIDNFSISLLPIITNQPQSVAASPGSTVNFTVGASGGKPLFYQWLKNSNNIPNATNTTLTLNNVGQSDSGYYSVIVSNSAGAVTSTNALLTVSCSVPAGFATQPASQNLNGGDTLNLSVTASGTTPIIYQWYRNGAPIPTGTNATYTKVNAQPTDSGIYNVVINNCFDSPITSDSAVISIADAPYLLVAMTNHIWRYANESTNIDLGDAWKAIDYPAESTWTNGVGMFGVESLAAIAPLIHSPLTLNHAGGANIVTHRMRTTFVFTNSPELVNLIFTNYIDDGAVVYLNGEELFRNNMPNGTIGYLTSASAAGPATEGTYFRTNFPGTRFRNGTNTVAVEIHQSGTGSSDVVYGLAILVSYFAPTPLVITNQPQSVVVEETKPTVLTLGVRGEPVYYQWYKDGAPISMATTNPFVIPITTTNDAGTYFVIATNVINSVTSSVVSVTVSPDTNGPTLVDADGTEANIKVLVSFSERINATNATNIANYKITNTVSGAMLMINSATLQANGTNVLLNTAARSAGANYILVVNNIRDISPRANLIAPNSSIPIRSLVNLIGLGSGGWRFYNPGTFNPADLGTAWKEFTYTNDTPAMGWGTDGFSIFWQGDETEVPGPVGSSLAQRVAITSYYRQLTPNFFFSPAGLQLSLSHVIDDGAVLYMNGTEFFRFNMPEGTINYQTPANSQINPVALVGPVTIPSSVLRLGSNVVAAELHTRNSVDIDKYFGIELDAVVQSFAVGPVFITKQPENATVFEGSSNTFKPTIVGGLTFQWQQNGTNLVGETNPALTLVNIPLTYNGYLYRVTATGTNGASVTSSNAVLTVIGDTNAPSLVSAYLTNNGNNVLVTFSENMGSASATAIGNYLITNSAGQTQQLSTASLNNRTVTLTAVSALAPGIYYLAVKDVRDASTVGNLINPNPSSIKIGYQSPLITYSNAWKFNQDNVDFGSSFAARTYDDSTWQTSNALFAAKNGTIPTQPVPVNTILTRTNNGTDIKTYYFRVHLSSYSAGSGVLTFSTVLDDGCIIYFNGAEVHRIGMGLAADTLALLSARTVGDVAETDGPISVPVTNVVAGDNVIAVSVHESSAGSTDMYWAGEFSLLVSSAPQEAPRPILITTQPRSRTNAVGSAASLYVVATGDPTLTYQWRKDNVNLSGQTNSTIIFNPVQSTNAGNYTVVVTNSFSSITSSVATVTVTNGPGGCTPVIFSKPVLTMVLTNSGANVLLYWTNSVTNSCGDRFPYMLQQTLVLSNTSASTPWSNLGTSSPVVLPKTNSFRFFRLFGP